jgi:hypothetical protein
MGIALTVQISLGAASFLAAGLFQVAHPLVKNSESDGARYGFERGDETVVPLMIDVQDGIPDSPFGVVDLSFHVDASFREHPVYGEQHSGNVPMNVCQPVILRGALELAVGQIHAEPGVAGL